MAKSKNLLGTILKLPHSLLTFIKESRDELGKVSWPSRAVTTRHTIIVIVSSIAVGGIIGGIDYALRLLLEQFVL